MCSSFAAGTAVAERAELTVSVSTAATGHTGSFIIRCVIFVSTQHEQNANILQRCKENRRT